MNELMFFIAIMPNEEIEQEVTNFKHYLDEHFEATHALKSPPHITLFPPFQWQLNQEKLLLESLSTFAAKEEKFTVSLKDFNTFSPHVIFIDIEQSEALQSLQKRLESYLKERLHLKNDRSYPTFTPHLTIAHKDLKRDVFPKAWAHFSTQTYQRIFPVHSMALLQHKNGRWEVYKEFSLG